MDQLLYLYEPHTKDLHLTSLVSIVLLLAAIAGVFFNQKRKVPLDRRNFRQLWTLLLSFVALLAFVALVFSFLTNRRIGTIKIFTDRIETNEGSVLARDVGRIYIHVNPPQSALGLPTPGDTTRVLILEEWNGKAHVFSEYNYAIDQMLEEMQRWMARVREENKKQNG